MNEEFLVDLTQDLLPIAAFLNEEAQRELDHLWDAVRHGKSQPEQQPEENSITDHDTASDHKTQEN